MSLLRLLASLFLTPEAANAAPPPWGLKVKSGLRAGARPGASSKLPEAERGGAKADRRSIDEAREGEGARLSGELAVHSEAASRGNQAFREAGASVNSVLAAPGMVRGGSRRALPPIEVLHLAEFVPVVRGTESFFIARCETCAAFARVQTTRLAALGELDEACAVRERWWPRTLHVDERPDAEGWA